LGKFKVHIDQLKCIGSGQCVFTAPKVFDQREEDGIVVLLTDTPDTNSFESVKNAEQLCPAMAIRIE
jgi:ferredoxin